MRERSARYDADSQFELLDKLVNCSAKNKGRYTERRAAAMEEDRGGLRWGKGGARPFTAYYIDGSGRRGAATALHAGVTQAGRLGRRSETLRMGLCSRLVSADGGHGEGARLAVRWPH